MAENKQIPPEVLELADAIAYAEQSAELFEAMHWHSAWAQMARRAAEGYRQDLKELREAGEKA